MNLFQRIRQKEKMEKGIREYFTTINSYVPIFKTFEGSIYEMELTRAAIHSFATHASKLQPQVMGSNNQVLERRLQNKPNPLMDTKKYLYRLATVYKTDNTAFIVPLYDRTGEIIGFYPLATEKTHIVKEEGQTYLVYEFAQGDRAAIEIDRVGIMNQFQYRDEIFGETNSALKPTMELINTNNQGIIEGVKSAASIRFMAKLAQTLKAKDIEDERQRFVANNLSASNNGGVLMFDQKYEDIKQINSTPYVVNEEQMKAIRQNVFEYFNTNENILMNKFNSAEWNAYYEGALEPFAIEASLVHTNMTFSDREIACGNKIIFTSNRLQYLSATEKVSLVAQLFDRGFITLNDGREIFNLSPIEDGDRYFIRKEYVETSKMNEGKEEDNAGVEEQGVQTDESASGEDGGEEV